MDNYSYSNQDGNKSSHKGILVGLIVCTVCAIVSLGLGVLSIIQIGQINKDLYGEDTDDIDESKNISCTIPKSASEISYVLMTYNKGNDQVYVDAENEIYYYSAGTNLAGDETSAKRVVQTDTSLIMQQIFENGLSGLKDYDESVYTDEGGINWDWVAELGTTDEHICQAGGKGASPAWFNNLVEMTDNKQ